jgi:DNA replication protein DnaC
MSDLATALAKIGMRMPYDTLRAFRTHAQRSRLSPTAIVEQLCAIEQQERDARNLARRTKAAMLARTSPLDKFDWNHPPKIDRELYGEPLTLEFLRRGENILFRGQAGIGKSSLAQNLGVAALTKGYQVKFATVSAALIDLIRQESIPATERRLKRSLNPDLLILDELGYVPCDSRAADMLFHIVSRRHEKRAIIITTNLALTSNGPAYSAKPLASAHWSTASPSTATPSTSTPTPGAKKTPSSEGSRQNTDQRRPRQPSPHDRRFLRIHLAAYIPRSRNLFVYNARVYWQPRSE